MSEGEVSFYLHYHKQLQRNKCDLASHDMAGCLKKVYEKL